ncbi:MAG: hypothetical protein GX580_05000 [Candidatus Hydrogenedens sp.]|nr:hypothetical protein [Candidatus Hydrogenedens sp.]
MRAQVKAGWMGWGAAALLAVLLLSGAAAHAQAKADEADIAGVLGALEAPAAVEMPVLRRDGDGFIHFLAAPESGRFILPDSGQKSDDPAARALAFMEGHAGAFGVPSPKLAFEARVQERPTGTVVRLSQTYAGLPVLGAQAVIRLDADGQVRMVLNDVLGDASTLDNDPDSLTPLLTPEEAVAAAKRAEAGVTGGDEALLSPQPDPELVIFAPAVYSLSGDPVLAYRVVFGGVNGMVLFINARNGELVFRHALSAAALAREIYDCNGGTDFLTAGVLARKEGDPPTGNTGVDNAYDYFGDTYKWYKDLLGRDSYDDKGSLLKAYVNVPVLNAYWYPGLEVMVFDNRLLTDDVLAHEFTHGVTDDVVNFTYFGFSGALAEMYSDWGGELVDLSNGRGNDSPEVRWFCGEDMQLKIPDSRGRERPDPVDDGLPGLRYMKDPTLFGDPDRLGSPLLANPYSMYDLGGVHINNGVGNKLVYLLTDGDTFNGETVRGLGEDVVGQLFYEALFNLSASADYYDLYFALGVAATDLGLSFEDRLNIAAAGRAVEIEPPELALLGLRNFRATPARDGDGNQSIALTWSNPPADTLAGITLVRSLGRYAMQPGDGVILPVTRGADAWLDTAVEPGIEYYYTVIADITGSFPQLAYAKARAGGNAPNVLSQPFGTDPLLGRFDPLDLAFSQLTFTPVGAADGPIAGDMPGVSYDNYEATCRRGVYSLPVPRADGQGGAIQLNFSDDNGTSFYFPNAPFPFFGKYYPAFTIAANGYISFQDVTYLSQLNFPSLAAHFAIPRISFLFNDFSPSMGGLGWARALSDRTVITFEDMPSWPPTMPTTTVGRSTVQVELFHSGMIRFTYLGLGATNAVVGLSDGRGVPRDPSLAFPAAGLLQSYAVPDLSALPLNPSRLSISPLQPVYAVVGDLVQFDVSVNKPAGLAGIPVLLGDWSRTGPAPFADRRNGTGTFSWRPAPEDRGVYTFRVTARLGGQEAYQDVMLYIGRAFDRPGAKNLAISSDTPFENPAQSRVVPMGRPLTASYEYTHPHLAFDPAYYGEGGSVLYWFRNGQVISELIGRTVVPPGAVRAGDRWWFGVVPVTVNGLAGDMVFSPTVTIAGFPVVTSVSPAFGLTIGGDRVTIRGERLGGAMAVTFGGVRGANLAVRSDNEIQVTTPLHPGGVVDIVVESMDGIGRAVGAFRFIGDATDLLREDVNKDGRVDAVDVQLVTGDVLKTGEAAKDGLATDVNGDGVVNALDIQMVVNRALLR